MTAIATDLQVPEWDQIDRLYKALRVADVTALEMAEYLGVTRGTVATWLHGKIQPSTQSLRVWAMRTGVPFEWLQDGTCAVRDSNPEPADYGPDALILPLVRPTSQVLEDAA